MSTSSRKRYEFKCVLWARSSLRDKNFTGRVGITIINSTYTRTSIELYDDTKRPPHTNHDNALPEVCILLNGNNKPTIKPAESGSGSYRLGKLTVTDEYQRESFIVMVSLEDSQKIINILNPKAKPKSKSK
jgi:hypothetical protein